MADLSGLGDLVLTVGGDISPLENALNDIPAAAQDAAGKIQAAFDALPSATDPVAESMASIAQATQQAGQQITILTPEIRDLKPPADEASKSIFDLAGSFAKLVGVDITARALIAALEDLARAAIGTYAEIERTTIALTAMRGSVEQATNAVAGLKLEALALAVPFDQLIEANQKVIALGFSARQASESLRAAADAAAAVGLNFSNVAPAMDRIAQSGNLVARQLATIGLNLGDVAKAMNATVEDLQGPGNIFKALDPGDRMDVLIAALQKYQGTAQAVAQSLSGQFQNLRTQIDLALSGIGEALAPLLKSLMDTAQLSVVPAIEAMVQGFKDLAAAIGPLVSGILNEIVTQLSDFGTLFGAAISALSKFDQAGEASASSWKTFLDTIRVIDPFHLAATEIDLLRGSVAMFNQDALIMSKRFSDVTDSLKTFIDKAANSSGLLAVRLEMEAQVKALADAKANLDLYTKAFSEHLATAGQVKKAQDDYNKALYDMDPAAKVAAEALKKMQTELDNTAKSVQLLLQKVPETYDAYINSLEQGGQKATAMVSQIEVAINKASAEMETMSGKPLQGMIQWVETLEQLADRAKAFADQDAFGKMAVQVSQFADKYAPALAGLDAATLDFVNSMTSAARDVPEAVKKITDTQALDAFGQSFEKLAQSTQTLAKETTKWQDEYYKAAQQQIKITGDLDWTFGQFTQRVRTSGDEIKQLIGSINAVGVQTAQQMQSSLSAINQAVAAGAELYAKGTISLLQYDGLLQTQLQDQIKINEAIGASGTATLALTEKLAAVRIQEGLLKDQTEGLSTLYMNMLGAFGKAWDELGKGIGDAIVSGQNFGQVFTNVFDNLKKSLAEFVTQYLMGMLKEALLQNGEFLKAWNSLFNGIFGAGGNVATGLQQTSQAFQQNSQIMVSSFGQAASSVQNSTASMTSSLQSMVSVLGVVAAVVGAIAGIFSAIELAHTNTLLSRIEESTRRMDIAFEQQGDSALATLHTIRDKSIIVTDFLWNFLATAMQQVMEKMDTQIQLLMQISTAAWTGGGGATAASGSAVGTTLQPTIAIPQAAQLLSDAGVALSDAAAATNSAADSTQAAADASLANSQNQAALAAAATNQTTYAAANINYGAQQLVYAASTLNGAAASTSYEALKAATITQQTATVVAQAANVVAASQTMLAAVMPALGGPALTYTPGGSSVFTPFTPPAVSLPNVGGPGGAMTGGLRPAAWTSEYQGSYTPTGTVVNINGSYIDSMQTVDRLASQIVNRLQNKGVRIMGA